MAEYFLPRVEGRIYLDEAGKLYSETPVTSAEDAVQLLAEEMKGLSREAVYALFLDNRSRPISCFLLGLGAANYSPVFIGELFRAALANSAASFILMHNHPSGIPEPSGEDFAVTDRIREAAALLEIQFLDHIVVGKNGAWSIVHKTKKQSRRVQRKRRKSR